jgi:hypothetical protein
MRLFSPPLEIGKEEGFTSEKDIFDYQSFGERLEEFYGSFDDPVVGILDAPWGSGKTTFIKMWCGHMRKAGYPIIEFDAFKNDYTDDAFIALAGEVLSLAKEHGLTENEYKPFKERTAKVVVAAAKGAVKKGLCNVFSDEGYEEMSAAAEGASDAIFKGVMEQLDNRKNERQMFEKFGDALQKLASTLGKTCNQNDPKHLIFVIDELDRCKPTFALALLEKIKHFYAVPNVHFLLVTNLNQLSKVVKCEYGSEVNGTSYLQKFYDISFSLPTKNDYTDNLNHFCAYLTRQCETPIENNWLSALPRHFNMSLRATLQMHTYAAAMIAGRDNIYFGYKLIFVGLACLKVAHPEYFKKILSGQLSREDVYLLFPETNKVEYFRAAFLYAIKQLPRDDAMYDQMLRSFDRVSSEDILQNKAIQMHELQFPM